LDHDGITIKSNLVQAARAVDLSVDHSNGVCWEHSVSFNPERYYIVSGVHQQITTMKECPQAINMQIYGVL
jgi:hypothetical protein